MYSESIYSKLASSSIRVVPVPKFTNLSGFNIPEGVRIIYSEPGAFFLKE